MRNGGDPLPRYTTKGLNTIAVAPLVAFWIAIIIAWPFGDFPLIDDWSTSITARRLPLDPSGRRTGRR